MNEKLREAEAAIASVRLARSAHYAGLTIRHYECVRKDEDTDRDLAFRAMMGVALARAYIGRA